MARKSRKITVEQSVDGISDSEILNRLDEMNAPNPEQRKREVGTRNGAVFSFQKILSSKLL